MTSAPSMAFVIGCCLMEFQLTVVMLHPLEGVEILFNSFEEVFLKINSNISFDIMEKEYLSMIIYSLNHLMRRVYISKMVGCCVMVR